MLRRAAKLKPDMAAARANLAVILQVGDSESQRAGLHLDPLLVGRTSVSWKTRSRNTRSAGAVLGHFTVLRVLERCAVGARRLRSSDQTCP